MHEFGKCRMTAIMKHYIKKHVYSKHVQHQSLFCPFCNKTCQNDQALRKHQQRNHMNELQLLFQCLYCEHTSKWIRDFTKHIVANHIGAG